MYAIVDIQGQQYKVEKGTKLFVNRLEKEEGSDVDFQNVLLIENEDKVEVGSPTLNVTVSAKIIKHCKGDTVLVFKKKRRKSFQKLNGHRQYLSEIEIQSINL